MYLGGREDGCGGKLVGICGNYRNGLEFVSVLFLGCCFGVSRMSWYFIFYNGGL